MKLEIRYSDDCNDFWELSSQGPQTKAKNLSARSLGAKLPKKLTRGFTLIETLVYLALYTIIIGGTLAAAYGMVESAARNETMAMVEEEGNFLIGKIDWILADTVSVQSPEATGGQLSPRAIASTARRYASGVPYLVQ